jgi:hypothetical protein
VAIDTLDACVLDRAICALDHRAPLNFGEQAALWTAGEFHRDHDPRGGCRRSGGYRPCHPLIGMRGRSCDSANNSAYGSSFRESACHSRGLPSCPWARCPSSHLALGGDRLGSGTLRRERRTNARESDVAACAHALTVLAGGFRPAFWPGPTVAARISSSSSSRRK